MVSRRVLLRRALELGASMLPLASAVAQGIRSAGETQIKAAYLFKFLAFTEWPTRAFDGREAPLVIGVMGSEALMQELSQTVAGRAVADRAVSVRELRTGDSPTGLHVLFVGRAAAHRLSAVLAAAKGQPLLTVGEAEDGQAQVVAINFVVVDEKVRFDILPSAAELAGLKISSRLLAVARKVTTGS
ncbi:YfiR family protein [Rhizobacter sp. P5_C2]